MLLRLRRSEVWGAAVLVAVVSLSLGACGGKAATNSGGGSRGGDGDGDTSVGDGDSGDGDGDPGDDIRRSCETTSECVLVSAGCCAPCSVPTAQDVTAVHFDSVAAHQQAVCADTEGCPECAGGTNPRLFATCEEGRCEVADLEADPAVDCTTTEECILIPAACCECGAGNGPEEIVAINGQHAQDFRESQCARVSGGDPVACLACEWTPPEDLVPICTQGHCSFIGTELLQ